MPSLAGRLPCSPDLLKCAAHPFKERIDGKRITAHEAWPQVLNDGNRLCTAVHTFSYPGDVSIRFDFDPEVHAVASGRCRLDICDLQISSFFEQPSTLSLPSFVPRRGTSYRALR